MRFLIIIFILFLGKLQAQEIRKHQWEKRVVLIVSKTHSDLASKQWNELIKDAEGLKERKLVIYQVLPEYFKTSTTQKKQLNTRLYSKFKTKKSNFQIVLIGLDGGIKLKQANFLSSQKLFTFIDGMPMRRNELRNKN